ncbi:uncharacterized protein LOC111004768 [Momordica charantia]|uniref:Uncharacterized protein LOC111004768 n=1 Tax=Momordica charantia TaxID=3673 RepID=A0A6J1BQU1_MOMCH|nr:uncharacterized protein LOC111004768 [Momordica charantia]
MLADFHHSSSFAHKLKSSIGCFRASDQPSTKSPCSWFKSTAAEFPDLLDRCRYLVARIGRGSRRRYHASPDFTYDSSSYALNFEDDSRYDDEFPLRNFAARLPRLPAAKFAGSQAGVSTVAACS